MPKRPHNEDEDGEYDDSTQKAKKQKKLSISEQCKEHTRELQEAMTRLGNFLTANSLVDDSARDDMEMLSVICAEILQNEDGSKLRPRAYADTVADRLNDPLDMLADDALGGLTPSALKILTNHERRVSL